MSIKINRLEIENVKRVRAVTIEPNQDGLTILGGNNKQGKTSVLDSIAWALGGNRFKPDRPQNENSVLPPNLKVIMDNGLVVERKGKNSTLKVTDPSGNNAGQSLLDEFVEELAIDLPKFMAKSSKEKAQTLLQIIGVGDQLFELEQKELEIYNERRAIGQIADRKAKFAEEQAYFTDAPADLVSASELIQQQQEILARNGENQKKRLQLETIRRAIHGGREECKRLEDQIEELSLRLIDRRANLEMNIEDEKIAMKTVAQLQDESTEELERSIEEVDLINSKVKTNFAKLKAEEDAKEYKDQYDEKTILLDQVRQQKIDLLKGADLPLEGLSVEEGELTFNGFQWSSMSGAEQLKVATSIVRKLKPKCGFVLIDKLEAMDLKELEVFGSWLKEEGLQAIATRVSTGEECSLIIEDGMGELVHEPTKPKFVAGEF